MLVFYCDRNKLPETQHLKTTPIYDLTVSAGQKSGRASQRPLRCGLTQPQPRSRQGCVPYWALPSSFRASAEFRGWRTRPAGLCWLSARCSLCFLEAAPGLLCLHVAPSSRGGKSLSCFRFLCGVSGSFLHLPK